MKRRRWANGILLTMGLALGTVALEVLARLHGYAPMRTELAGLEVSPPGARMYRPARELGYELIPGQRLTINSALPIPSR